MNDYTDSRDRIPDGRPCMSPIYRLEQNRRVATYSTDGPADLGCNKIQELETGETVRGGRER